MEKPVDPSRIGATSRRKLHRALQAAGADVVAKDGELIVRTRDTTLRIGCRGHEVAPRLVRKVSSALARDGVAVDEFYHSLYRRPKAAK